MRLRGLAFRAFCQQPSRIGDQPWPAYKESLRLGWRGAHPLHKGTRRYWSPITVSSLLAMPHPPEGPLEDSRTPCCLQLAQKEGSSLRAQSPGLRVMGEVPFESVC